MTDALPSIPRVIDDRDSTRYITEQSRKSGDSFSLKMRIMKEEIKLTSRSFKFGALHNPLVSELGVLISSSLSIISAEECASSGCSRVTLNLISQ